MTLTQEKISDIFKSIKTLKPEDMPVEEISLNDVHIDIEENARKVDSEDYNEENIEAFAKSIISAGRVLTPIWVIKVTPNESNNFKQYVLFSGFRRSLSSKKAAELTKDGSYINSIRAIVYPAGTPVTAIKNLQILENIRSDLSLIEIGRQIHSTVQDDESTVPAYAELLNIKKSKAIAGYRIIKNFPADIVKKIEDGDIPEGSAILLANSDTAIGDLDKWAKVASRLGTKQLKESLEKTTTDPGSGKSDTKEETVDIETMPKAKAKKFVPFIRERRAKIKKLVEADVDSLSEDAAKAVKGLKEVKFTQADLDLAVINALESFCGCSDEPTEVVKVFEGKLAEEKAKEDAEKEKNKAESKRKKFINSQVTALNKMMDEYENEETGERRYKNITDAVRALHSNWTKMPASDVAELGFDFGPDKRAQLANDVGHAWKEKKQNKLKKKKKADKNIVPAQTVADTLPEVSL